MMKRKSNLKKTFSSSNISAAENVYEYIKYQQDSLKDEIPNISREVVKSTIIIPQFFTEKAYRLCVDVESLNKLEPNVINWCDSVRNLVPINIQNDNNSLCHAVSMYIFGVHDKNHTIRQLLYARLFTEEENDGEIRGKWLTETKLSNPDLDKSVVDKQWKNILLSLSERADKTNILPIHIFALSVLIGRPIIVLSADPNIKGVYLPLLKRPIYCEKSPVILGCVNKHFVPLLSSENPKVPFSKHQPSEMAQHFVPIKDLTLHFISTEQNMGDVLTSYMEIVMVPHQGIDINAVMLKFRAPPAYSVELLWNLQQFADTLTEEDFFIEEPDENLTSNLIKAESVISDDMLYDDIIDTEEQNKHSIFLSNNERSKWNLNIDNKLILPCSRNVMGCTNLSANNSKGYCETCYQEFLEKSRGIIPRTKTGNRNSGINQDLSDLAFKNDIASKNEHKENGYNNSEDIPIANSSMMKKCKVDHCTNVGKNHFHGLCEDCYKIFITLPPSMNSNLKDVHNRSFQVNGKNVDDMNELENESYNQLDFTRIHNNRNISEIPNGDYDHLNSDDRMHVNGNMLNGHINHGGNRKEENLTTMDLPNDYTCVLKNDYLLSSNQPSKVHDDSYVGIHGGSINSTINRSNEGITMYRPNEIDTINRFTEVNTLNRHNKGNIMHRSIEENVMNRINEVNNMNRYNEGSAMYMPNEGSTMHRSNEVSSMNRSEILIEKNSMVNGAAGGSNKKEEKYTYDRSKVLCCVAGCENMIDIDDERHCTKHKEPTQKCLDCDNFAVSKDILLCTTCYEKQLGKRCEINGCENFIDTHDKLCNQHFESEYIKKCINCNNKAENNKFLLCQKCLYQQQRKDYMESVDMDNIGRGAVNNEDIAKHIANDEITKSVIENKAPFSGNVKRYTDSLPSMTKCGQSSAMNRNSMHRSSFISMPAPPRFDNNSDISPLDDHEIESARNFSLPPEMMDEISPPGFSPTGLSPPPMHHYQGRSRSAPNPLGLPSNFGEIREMESQRRSSENPTLPHLYDGFIPNATRNAVLDWQKSAETSRSNSFTGRKLRRCKNCREPGRPEMDGYCTNCFHKFNERTINRQGSLSPRQQPPRYDMENEIPPENLSPRRQPPRVNVNNEQFDNHPGHQTRHSSANSPVRTLQNPPNNEPYNDLSEQYEFLFHEDAQVPPSLYPRLNETMAQRNDNTANPPQSPLRNNRNQPERIERQKCLKEGCDFYGDESYGGYCYKCLLEKLNEDDQAPIIQAQQRNNEQINHQQPPQLSNNHTARQKCLNDTCDMFGSFEFDNYCSKCFKDRTRLVERDGW